MGLVSVNVSLPKYLGEHRGRPVLSGIAKVAVVAEEIRLDRENLEGDGQGDPNLHGGLDKAVYAYPSEHLAPWSAELGQELAPAAFGENLTTTGWTEDDVRIGDLWEWGDAVLEVCQPRWPCYKLAMYRGRGGIQRRMHANGRTGWYLRVLEPGLVPVAGPVRVQRHPALASVRLAHDAASPDSGVPDEVIEALLALPAMADEWKMRLVSRLP
ncbi:MAG: MOSC domain-containing protein [Actinomycetota bacterium]|nr:MOSC domain-containing protein [Actinomycetota bacterium]